MCLFSLSLNFSRIGVLPPLQVSTVSRGRQSLRSKKRQAVGRLKGTHSIFLPQRLWSQTPGLRSRTHRLSVHKETDVDHPHHGATFTAQTLRVKVVRKSQTLVFFLYQVSFFQADLLSPNQPPLNSITQPLLSAVLSAAL